MPNNPLITPYLRQVEIPGITLSVLKTTVGLLYQLHQVAALVFQCISLSAFLLFFSTHFFAWEFINAFSSIEIQVWAVGLNNLEAEGNKLEDVDLNDQHGLIAMADSTNKIANSSPVYPTEKIVTVAEETSKNVTCRRTTAYFLFFIALAAVVLSSFTTYWVTKGIYDRSLEIKPFADYHSLATNASIEELSLKEETNDPTAAELRLPKDLVPIWYAFLHCLHFSWCFFDSDVRKTTSTMHLRVSTVMHLSFKRLWASSFLHVAGA
ncbi:unnamed protein product [Gongylonema pulchrum]|uniref:Col_cuticle_N domain-containing protein n=1 Tax=Gongylonema pulchrum TaxID=637853 RepID=A0A183DAT8_9BILA|nr:unnamed protein product [Gongylonema pulchrum]